MINTSYSFWKPEWTLDGEHLVTIPTVSNFGDLGNLLTFPDFSLIAESSFWVIAVTLAVIGSIETLLSVDAADKMDSQKG
ncbi:hypothetical protein V8V91_01975 [Algoriphagus halophilus]|uniref:hypothetical protein n=1 Tax=Algoriphagus halophilus TaxID=226505 RepID=UPI00358E7396